MDENFNYLFFIGIGILIYGICYFIVHDVIIHQRFNGLKILNGNIYFNGEFEWDINFHKSLIKEGGESFK